MENRAFLRGTGVDPSQWRKVRRALESLIDALQDQDAATLDVRVREAAEEVGVDADLLHELLGADRPSAALARGVDLLAILDRWASFGE